MDVFKVNDIDQTQLNVQVCSVVSASTLNPRYCPTRKLAGCLRNVAVYFSFQNINIPLSFGPGDVETSTEAFRLKRLDLLL